MTQYTISSSAQGSSASTSETLTAEINSVGAELISLCRNPSASDQIGAEQYMWEGDPDVWSGRAPILFPIVGSLKEGRYQVDNQWYEMPQHGFARKEEFSCVSHDDSHLRLQLVDSDSSRRLYPWQFKFEVEFSWRQSELVIAYHVTNTDERELLFNVGSHPAFRLPLGGRENHRIEDYRIEFSDTETLDTYAIIDALLEPVPTRFLTADTGFALTPTLFDHDALVFMNIRSRTVSLAHRQNGTRVAVDTGGAPHLGIWAKPAAPYVCIEPWWGFADFKSADGMLEHKPDIQRLAAGDTFSTSIGITTD